MKNDTTREQQDKFSEWERQEAEDCLPEGPPPQIQGNSLTLNSEHLDRIIANFSTFAPHFVPIWRAVRDHGVLFTEIHYGWKGSPIPRKFWGRGMTIKVGDDLPPAAKGPEAFHRKTLGYVFELSDFICVHATGAAVEHYQMLADLAASGRRVLLVETQPCQVDNWLAFRERHGRGPITPANAVLISPTPGGEHPTPPPGEQIH